MSLNGKVLQHIWICLLLSASIGGLLSVGFGFSVISAFEVVYYILIRWYFKKIPGPNEKQHLPNIIDPSITLRSFRSNANAKLPQIPTRRRRRAKTRLIRVYPKLDQQQQQQIYSISSTFETSLARYFHNY